MSLRKLDPCFQTTEKWDRAHVSPMDRDMMPDKQCKMTEFWLNIQSDGLLAL
jgi:hypothetical protein